jgi:uncharacterized protein YjbJ (UPF0337 family)
MFSENSPEPENDNGLESGGRKLEADQRKIKEKWGQLTDDDLTQIDGKRDQLEGKIQERYGLAKDRASKDIDDWLIAGRSLAAA